LIDMGVEPFLVASSVEALVAQRLVRTLCNECKRPADLSKFDLEEIGFPQDRLAGSNVCQHVGCEVCRSTGYRGRTGIYEVLVMDDSIRPLVINQSSLGQSAARHHHGGRSSAGGGSRRGRRRDSDGLNHVNVLSFDRRYPIL